MTPHYYIVVILSGLLMVWVFMDSSILCDTHRVLILVLLLLLFLPLKNSLISDLRNSQILDEILRSKLASIHTV